jgi:hypothetical protein
LISVCEARLAYAREEAGHLPVADCASFRPEDVEALLARFTGDDEHGIELPGIGKTLAPATLLGAWVPALLARFSTSQTSIIEEAAPESDPSQPEQEQTL